MLGIMASVGTYRIHVTKVTSIYKTTRFNKGYLLLSIDRVRGKDVGKRVALWCYGSICAHNTI